jgi:hypothetical protein
MWPDVQVRDAEVFVRLGGLLPMGPDQRAAECTLPGG